jgi:prephenate dehydrogenase
MRPDTLGVIGLGAIGGSIAWQAVRAGIRRVIGFSVTPAEMATALRCGAITAAGSTARAAVRDSDLVVLATPPGAVLELLRRPILDGLRPDALCTDAAGIKGPIARHARELGLADRFAGSHPFVSELGRGFGAARPARFRGALVYVTPTGTADGPAREVADFWKSVLEAEPVLVTPEQHDVTVGWTAYLPRLVAGLLADTLSHDGPRGVSYGPIARDTTRWAVAGVDWWRELLLLNRANLLAALDGVEGAAGRLRRALAEGDERALAAWLEGGAAWRRRLGS